MFDRLLTLAGRAFLAYARLHPTCVICGGTFAKGDRRATVRREVLGEPIDLEVHACCRVARPCRLGAVVRT